MRKKEKTIIITSTVIIGLIVFLYIYNKSKDTQQIENKKDDNTVLETPFISVKASKDTQTVGKGVLRTIFPFLVV